MPLVLTRKNNESIVITTPAGEEITVTAEALSASQVKLVIDAPRDVLVVREELLNVSEDH